MSEVTVESLQNELKQANLNFKGLVAQLEAAKQMVNECLEANLKMKTNMIMFQQAHHDLTQENKALKETAVVPV